LRAGFNPRSDTKDGTHPNVRGEQKIANRYFQALRKVL
jgi:lysophospholipase L1-like esterase